MMILPAPNGMDKDVTDLYGDQFTVALAQAMTRLECAPYWHAGEKAPARLIRAGELVRLSRVQLHDERTATVHGATRSYDLTGYHCTCPQSTKGQTHWCVHSVAVKLARTLAEQGPRTPRPDEDDTPDTGYPIDDATLPLPIGPTTIDERLATPAREEVPMPADPYIPEPDEELVAVLEAAAPPPLPPRVTIPAEYVMQIQGRRHVLYAGLVIGAQHSGLVSLSADWTYNDAELSLAHAVATFADGRRYEDSGDASPSNVTKSVAKHFRRVALTRAKARCLRDALGIQECSVEELAEAEGKREVPTLTPPQTEPDLKRRIWQLVKQQDPTITTREQVALAVRGATGLALEPDQYGAIVAHLEGGGR